MSKNLRCEFGLFKILLVSVPVLYGQVSTAETASKDAFDKLLSLSIEELLNVTIATRTERPVSKVPSTVFVYEQKDIRRHGWNSLAELVQDIPGVDIVNKGGRGVTLSTRGVADLSFHGSKTVVMIDGHNTAYSSKSSPSFGGFMNEYDIFNAKRVEVALGPGGTLYGANAFGITINIITMDPEDIAGVESDFIYGSQGEYIPSVRFGNRDGKLGTFQSFTAWVQTDSELAEIPISKNQDGSLVVYDNDSFEPQTSENFELHGYIDYDHNFRLGYRYSKIDSVRGTSQVSSQKGKLIVTQPMLYLDYNTELTERLSYKLSSHYKESKTDLAENYFINTTLNRVGVSGDESNSLVIDNQFTFLQNNQLTWVSGLFLERSRQRPAAVRIVNGTIDPEDRLPPVPNEEEDYDNYAGYLQTEWIPDDAFYMVAGLRYIVTESKYPSELVPRLGLSYKLSNDWTTKFNYQKGYRPPGVGEGRQRGSVAPNPDLNSEIIDSIELSLTGKPTRKLYTRATYFNSKIHDLIERTAYTGSGSFSSVDDNIGTVNINGFELEANFKINEKYEIKSVVSYTESKNEMTGQDNRTIIPYKLNFSLIARPAQRWEIAWDNYLRIGAKTDSENALFAGEDADNWMLSNLTMKYDRPFDVKNLKFTFSIRNIFDEEYGHVDPRATVSSNANPPFLTSYHPQERRNILLGLNYHF